MKTKEIIIDNFRIKVSDKSIQLCDKSNMWRMEFSESSTAFGLILHLLSEGSDKELHFLVTILYVSTALVFNDASFVAKLSDMCMEYVSKDPDISDEDDSEALSEMRVLYEQDEESVDEHIKITKDE